jgi:hypothetical protein
LKASKSNDSVHALVGDPAHADSPLLVRAVLGASAEVHRVGVPFGARDLPGVAEAQPLVGPLDLPPVADFLVEDAELVADAVTDRGDAEGRERIHVARGEPAETAVAEPGLFLLFQQLAEVLPEPRERPGGLVPDAEVDQVVAEVGPGQELRGEVGHHLGSRLHQAFDHRQVTVEQAVAHGQGERHVPVVPCRVARGDRLLVVQVVGDGGGERLLPEAGANRRFGGGRSGSGRRLLDASRFHGVPRASGRRRDHFTT